MLQGNRILRVLVVSIIVLIAGQDSVIAQKQRPPTKRTVIPDTTGTGKKKPIDVDKQLPTLNLREYTITGTERVRVLPSMRNPVDVADYTRLERLPATSDRANRVAPGAGGMKHIRTFEQPVIGGVNEAYLSIGKYSDVNAGVKYRRKFTGSELFADIDLRRNSGHVDFAENSTFSGNIADVRPLTETIQNKAQLTFNFQNYKFYGSPPDPARKRSGYYFDLNNSTEMSFFEPVQMSFQTGGRYFDPDDPGGSDVFNWDAWAKLNMRSVIGSTFFFGSFEVNTDRVKDSGAGNAPVSDANYARAQIMMERLITPRFHLKAGFGYYHSKTKNAHLLYSTASGAPVISGPQVVEFEANDLYPQVAVTYDFGEQGRFFIEYEPKIDSFTLLDKLKQNQYLKLTTPLAYENVSQSIKVGWRRSYVHDLSFELFYNDRRIKNYGIPIDNGYVLDATQQGTWSMIYFNTIDANEYRGVLNWNPHPRFNAWTSISYTEYTVRESDFAERIPYVPNLISEVSLQFLPGWGTQFVLDGQYFDKRHYVPFNVDNSAPEPRLDDYFLCNLTISKQWNRQFSSYIYVYNIFDEEYQVWQGYMAPDLVSGAGLRYFW